uniref:Heme-binding-like protein At3g10130ic n=1 Tax=Rhizophora mucronata TaxID=61149 RepID=A0A2P2Q2Y0_RHIMU
MAWVPLLPSCTWTVTQTALSPSSQPPHQSPLSRQELSWQSFHHRRHQHHHLSL